MSFVSSLSKVSAKYESQREGCIYALSCKGDADKNTRGEFCKVMDE